MGLFERTGEKKFGKRLFASQNLIRLDPIAD